jgi:hypothetical protein
MTEKQDGEMITIKILRAEPRYGLRRGQTLQVRIIKREARFTIFFEPPMRQLTLYNEDWKEV